MRNFSLKTRANSPHNYRRARYTRLVVGIIVGVIFLYFFKNALGAFGAYLAEPVYLMRTWLQESSATIPSYLRSRSELLGEIRTLEEQVAAESGNLATLNRLAHENEELRGLMNISNEDRIAAGVIARPPFLPYDALMIDRGTNDGIIDQALVYVRDNIVIGYVSQVFSTSALVTLFSTPGVEGTAYIYGPNIYTTAHGEGGGVIRLSVPQGIALAEGDVVILPSTGEGTIGAVAYIESISTQPEQHAYVVQEIPLQSLRLVGVSSRVIRPMSYEEAERIVNEKRNQNLHIEVPVVTTIDSDFATGTPTTTEEVRITE